ncbi:MAG: hypothetical protein L3K07_00130 [Thermoplasmata archaeon]|nr:hypothetical protein [Thermoplasmata archaeon]
MRVRKLIRAPLPFVYRWCTDFREDDDRITNSIYHYRAEIVRLGPRRLLRLITLPGEQFADDTQVELIRLAPPDRWRLDLVSAELDETGSYQLRRVGRTRTLLEMRFEKRWRLRRAPDQRAYRKLFDRVWDLYVLSIEPQYGRAPKSPSRRSASG